MQKKKKIFELKSGIGERLGDIKNNGETIGILFFPPLAQWYYFGDYDVKIMSTITAKTAKKKKCFIWIKFS